MNDHLPFSKLGQKRSGELRSEKWRPEKSVQPECIRNTQPTFRKGSEDFRFYLDAPCTTQ